MKLRVGIDGGCWANGRGYGRFLRELVHGIAESPRHEYTIFLDEPGFRTFPELPGFRRVLVRTSQPVSEAAGADSRRSLPDLLRMSKAVSGVPLDVFFYPTVYSYFPLPRRIPVLLGIHDTMADRFPELAFASSRERRFWNWKVKLALTQANTILTVSHHSAKTIHEVLGVAIDRIHVVPEGAAACFQPLDVAKASEPAILAVGGLSPNKNLATLIRAFRRVAETRPDASLVLVGDYQSDSFKSNYSELTALAGALGLRSRIRFTGFVKDSELAELYNSSTVLAFPSLEEGFGLPAVEAMACGLPVVASNAHALKEIVGDAGLLVEALDEHQLAAAILHILNDPALAAQLREKSLARAAEFSWKRAASRVQELFQEIQSGR